MSSRRKVRREVSRGPVTRSKAKKTRYRTRSSRPRASSSNQPVADDIVDVFNRFRDVFDCKTEGGREADVSLEEEALTSSEVGESDGESESEVCLMVLEGNSKRAGLIVAYRLATELDNDKDRAAAVEWVREKKPNGVLDEKTILLAILSVRG